MIGDVTLEATRAIVIAAGARPVDLAIEGREHVVTSDQFLELPSMPPSVTFVGGGYISFEFAHVAVRVGAIVTILQRGQRPLSQFDPDLVDRLVARSRAAGIDVRLGAEVQAIERAGSRFRVAFRDEHKSAFVDANLVVHGAGRVPDVDDLKLSAGGVQSSRAGVLVNEYLQSMSNPIVWAAGDCAATEGPRFRRGAGYEGRIVAANLIDGRQTTADYRAIPSVVFTVPSLARVGLTEGEARAKTLEFDVKHNETSGWYSSRRLGEQFSAYKLLIEKGTDHILGAHLLGSHADESINLFALAMRAGVSAKQFKQMLWAYPTHASDTPYML